MSRKTRKLIWSVPLVATLAIVGALALFMALQPNQAAAQTEEEVPGAPTNAQTRALDQTTIELKWDAPSNDAGGVPDGYRIDYSADGIVWYSLVPNQSGTKYVDNKDLEASETRHYRVFAFNTAGTSRMLGPVEEATTPSVAPDAPTALVVTHGAAATEYADKEHLIVAWTPPVDPPGAPVTSYRIRVSKNNSSFNDLEKELKVKDASCSDAARRCQYTHKGLFESTERWYHIYAMNSVDESPVSETRSGMTAKGDIPHAPQNLRVGVTTAGEMRLYWDRPVTPPAVVGATHNPPGAPITGYYIVGGPVADDDSVVNADAGLLFKKPNDALTALEDGVNITVNAEAPSLDHVVFHSQGTERALNTGGELATLAKLAGRPSPRHETDVLRTHWGFQVMAVNRVVDRNVQNGRKIEVAVDTAGGVDGNWSSSIRVDDTANQTGMLARPTLRTERHAGSSNGRTGIKLDWEVADSVDGTEYRVEYSEDRIDWKVLTGPDAAVFAGFNLDGEFTPETAVSVMAESGVHQGIVAGTGYNYRVFAEQPEVVGAPEDRILTQSSAAHRETTATPDRPDSPVLGDPEAVSETELKMTVIVEETAAANEDPPVVGAESGDADVGFGKLVGYRIEISDDGRDWSKYKPVEIGPKRDVRYSYSEKDMKLTETKASPAPTDSTGEVQFRYTGLHQKATRHFRASTINNAPGTLKYSVATDPMVGTTNESAASDDPGGLVAKAQGRNNIELVWYARGDHITAAPVTGYKIESSPLNDKNECAETWTTLVENTMSTTTAHPHPDLMPGDGFCYRVFGINVVDVSTSFIGFGDDYASTYDADAQAMTDPTVVPGMPMNVTAMATSDNRDHGGVGSPRRQRRRRHHRLHGRKRVHDGRRHDVGVDGRRPGLQRHDDGVHGHGPDAHDQVLLPCQRHELGRHRYDVRRHGHGHHRGHEHGPHRWRRYC